MRRALLDTDTLSEIMKQRHAGVAERGRDYLAAHGRFTFSLITRYEVLRGLKAKGAKRQIELFEKQCLDSEVLGITDEVVVRAADLYADLRRAGQLIGDADLLIAATALVNGFVLVTTNVGHFGRISGLEIECWKQP